MSKKGRSRRTPERRISDKDTRSSLKYLERIQREAFMETKSLVHTDTEKR